MDWLSDWLIWFVSEENNPLGLLVIAGSTTLEYIFPPFPGDTIALFSAVLITAYGWSFAAVFSALMIGSVAGAMADYYLGHRLRLRSSLRKRAAKDRGAIIDGLITRFRRHGATYLVLNRFVPGIRALFFIAAGMAGMRPLPVLLYSAVSAALWNLGLIALGSLLGANLDRLTGWVKTYNLIAGGIVGAVIVGFIALWLIRRRRAAVADENADADESADAGESADADESAVADENRGS